MPITAQACSLNPYYAVILELLTSLVKRVHRCSEVEKVLPKVRAGKRLIYELACLITKPTLFPLTDGPRLPCFCYTRRTRSSALSHVTDSDTRRCGVACLEGVGGGH